MSTGPSTQDLPAPADDGAAEHLPGSSLPAIGLPATDGSEVALDGLARRTVVFVYPSIGGIDDALLEEWTAIPGARGCTPEACSFRDRHAAFSAAGVDVLGLSSQPSTEQGDAVERLSLPYPLLSDEGMELARQIRLPTFEFHGERYYKRLTLVVLEGLVEAALYPVFPPDEGAEQALEWLKEHPGGGD